MPAETTTGDSVDEHTITASHRGPGWADIVEALSVGDRVHAELPTRNGDVQWVSEWVTNTGDGYVEFGRYRIEVTDEDEYVRFSLGDRGVKLLEKLGDEWVDEDWTPSLNSLEAVPREAFEEDDWYMWEIGVSEVMGGGVSTDQTVFPEAPTRPAAEEKAKRWAGMGEGYTTVVYQEDRVEPFSEVTAMEDE